MKLQETYSKSPSTIFTAYIKQTPNTIFITKYPTQNIVQCPMLFCSKIPYIKLSHKTLYQNTAFPLSSPPPSHPYFKASHLLLLNSLIASGTN